MQSILYFAYIYRKPQDIEYFRILSNLLEKEGFQWRGIHLGVPCEDNVGYSVETIPSHCRIGDCSNEIVIDNPVPDAIKVAADMEYGASGGSIPLADIKSTLTAFAEYCDELLSKVKPFLVVIGHQFSGHHHIIRWLCEERNIRFIYHHAGVLPGTVVFEPFGQMAESWLCRQSELFQSLPVTDADMNLAHRYLEYVRKNPILRPGRKDIKTIRRCSKLEQARTQNRRIVLYAGINDFRTGVCPKSYPRSSWHSPQYEGTGDALHSLLALSGKLNFHILFKPHPSVTFQEEKWRNLSEHPSLSVFPEDSLDELFRLSDCVATIVSQIAYEALIAGLPVLLAGRMQLSGKGLCVEAINGDLEKAVINLLSWERKEHLLLEHVARLLIYYVHPWDAGLRCFLESDVSDAAKRIIELAHGRYYQRLDT